MSARKLQRIQHATNRYQATRDVIVAELDRGGAPRALLLAALELCECYVECTGGTLVTERLRGELRTLRARVEGEPALRAVDASPDASPSTYWPADSDWQIATERRRTASWTQTPTEDGILYAPGPGVKSPLGEVTAADLDSAGAP